MKTRNIALLAVTGLALAACSGGGNEEQPVNETVVANIGAPDNFANVTIDEPVAPVTTNATTTPPPVAELAPDEQTQDDADATGMTAKVDRNASEGQPAQ
ncbi:hypothetical protein P6144_20335 [Sphingomonas sp. HITSZ_GF]|uniref:hypothetical protein n=1 Tax=Sphingomonas sp. HITSZ_GF TaxID=3037247 RepID=UPI00240E5ECE|nr:hypothetical protein [Sphingomonas sp. HITSZ_GF]MDG2536020.1 hypothetical protein [Sphingomonas sp. HITSZ_GF]